MEDIVVFPFQKVLSSVGSASEFLENQHLKVINFQKEKNGHPIQYNWPKKALKGTVVNHTFHYMNGKRLEKLPQQSFSEHIK